MIKRKIIEAKFNKLARKKIQIKDDHITKWKQKIYEKRSKQLHLPKEQETVYKGFMGLQPKISSEQLDETINLVDTPIESMNHSAAVRKSTSFHQHRTGSKDGYEPANMNQLLSKNLICGKPRKEFFKKISTKNKWMFSNFLFSLISMLKYAEYFFIINSFRCSYFKQFYSLPEGFHTDEEEFDFRTHVNNALMIFVQYQEASRRTAAEQKGSPWEAFIRFMFKYPFILELRYWDPVALDNMVPISDNQ
jgi:hypothetical protein